MTVTGDPDDELRRLRSRVATLEDDKRVLEERLAFAWREVERIRTKLLDARPSRLQTAPPGTRRIDAEMVTPGELRAELAVLARVRPISLGKL